LIRGEFSFLGKDKPHLKKSRRRGASSQGTEAHGREECFIFEKRRRIMA